MECDRAKKETPAPIGRKRPRKDFRGQRREAISPPARRARMDLGITAPKGRDEIAQGNALGIEFQQIHQP